jgi:RNA polymerase sigma-70 factor (ECF subfamily)
VHDDEAMGAAASGGEAAATPALDDAALQRALDRLEPRLREAFLLKHVEQLSYDEMEAATGAGRSALKMRVKRACDALRAMLQETENA